MDNRASTLIVGLTVIILLLVSVPVAFVAMNNNSSHEGGGMVTVTVDYSYYTDPDDIDIIQGAYSDWEHSGTTMSKKFENMPCTTFMHDVFSPTWTSIVDQLSSPGVAYWIPAPSSDDYIKTCHNIVIDHE